MAKKTAAKREAQAAARVAVEPRRSYVSQAEIPTRTLREALAIPQALIDNFAGQPTPPHQVALALNISPTSSGWKYLTGAAVAYGLTKGGVAAAVIALDELGRRATAPTEEGDDANARAEAALRPTVCRVFFEKYNRAKLPPDHIALNVLRETLHVSADRAGDVLEILKDNGTFVGFIHSTKTGPFVALDDLQPMPVAAPSESLEELIEAADETAAAVAEVRRVSPAALGREAPGTFRVFISHSKNMAVVGQVKEILALYDIEYELAVEEETASIPVPQKIIAAMRRCQAAVMVVTADEQGSLAADLAINTNVLIEIGSAFVLYDQKVVLLWDRRLKVPSNIQGLYRCEFEGNELSFAIGTKLAKALKSFRR
jgi:predicted nucleotide-binding protein